MPTATNAEVLAALSAGELEVEGRLVAASNVALRVWLERNGVRLPAVYKPVRGERPLWDFEPDTLAARERAAYLVSDAGGWDLVPPTVLRDGPLGVGSVQQWVGALEGHESTVLRVDDPAALPGDHLVVLTAEDEDGNDVVVSHPNDPLLRSLTVLDLILNNADRKASAVITQDGPAPRLWAIDHGLCFHDEPKLRTVFWGFAGSPLTDEDLAPVRQLAEALDGQVGTELRTLLNPAEVDALHERTQNLLAATAFPEPPQDRYPLPWPLW